jgi:hypothetical protein
MVYLSAAWIALCSNSAPVEPQARAMMCNSAAPTDWVPLSSKIAAKAALPRNGSGCCVLRSDDPTPPMSGRD